MPFERPEDFYALYDEHRTYVRAEVRKKHMAEFTRNIWIPAQFETSHRVLELGCGVGLFLAYLKSRGVMDFSGVEMDAKVREYMPTAISEHVLIATIEDFLSNNDESNYDRIVMLDVFEHFSVFEGVELLRKLSQLLSPDGAIVLRTPNCSSPWGWHYQLGDLTHKSMNSPSSMFPTTAAAGLKVAGCYPYTRGSIVRRFTTRMMEGLLSRLLTDPPPVWTANFTTVIRPTS